MATTTALFISLDYLKQNSPIQTNVDGDTLRPYIVLCQEKYILPIVGSNLYSTLNTAVANNTLAGNYITLMNDYVQKCLLWYVLSEITWLNNSITNKGVQQKSSDYSKSTTDDIIMRLEAKALNNAEYYAQLLTKYLFANTNLFPEFSNFGNNIDSIAPNQNNYFSGIQTSQFPFNDGTCGDYPWWLFVKQN